MSKEEIWIVPFFGQGHLFPSMELCKRIASRNFNTVLVIPSHLSSSVPSSLRQYPLVRIAQIQSTSTGPGSHPIHHPPPPDGDHNQMEVGLENLLQAQITSPDAIRPICAILDVMVDWTAEIFEKFDIPTVGFFTSGACSAAMEYALRKAHSADLKPGEVRLLPGLPEEMALTYLDSKWRPHRPPGPPPPPEFGVGPRLRPPPPPPLGLRPPFGRAGPRKGGPPKPSNQPPWVDIVGNPLHC